MQFLYIYSLNKTAGIENLMEYSSFLLLFNILECFVYEQTQGTCYQSFTIHTFWHLNIPNTICKKTQPKKNLKGKKKHAGLTEEMMYTS